MNEIAEIKKVFESIIRAADARRAQDITALHVTEKTILADYFVMMTGTSSTHIRALGDEIEKKVKELHGIYPHHREGVNSSWVLLDYNAIVVHIFLSEAREMYALERLWGDSGRMDISKLLIGGN